MVTFLLKKDKGFIAPLFFILCLSIVTLCCQSPQGNKDVITEDIIEKITSSVFDESLYLKHLNTFTQNEHPFGSSRQKYLAEWIKKEVQSEKVEVQIQTFTASTPNPLALTADKPVATTIKKNGYNVIAHVSTAKDPECIILVGSHYDTKTITGIKYFGANDSGSSSALLMTLIKNTLSIVPQIKQVCDISFVWFDGEESVLEGWNDGLSHPAKQIDNTYGSRYFVKQLLPCKYANKKRKCLPQSNTPILYFLLTDMIGSPGVTLSQDKNSHPVLYELLLKANSEMDLQINFAPTMTSIEDDHIPFVKNNIASIDIIDFNHLDHWHKEGDIVSNISLNSLNKIRKLTLFSLLSLSANPKAFLTKTDR